VLKVKPSEKGFTLIEAIVAMVIFGIAFTGLYLVFGVAMKGANDAQKRMHLNLIANQIVENISAETRRDIDDDLNPFKTPDIYIADLQDCDSFSSSDIRKSWCTKLNEVIGGFQGTNSKQKRNVTVSKLDNNLYVDIHFVIGGDSRGNNTSEAVIARRIRP
jgi:prepilin-type N-terminal cleavage/methylation domain-containing protein